MFKTIYLLFNPQNSILNISMITFSIWLSNWSLFYTIIYYFSQLLMVDCIYYLFRWKIINPDETLRHGYNYGLLIDDDGSAHGYGLDYGFNYYNGDYTKSRRQAQIDKFQYAYDLLDLQPGMSVLDCGCGCGDWMDWLQNEKGVQVVGINITDGQVDVCRSRGLNVINLDWKLVDCDPTLRKNLYGRFDAVTFWDTVEHYCPAVYRNQFNKQDMIYQQMFKFANNLLKKESPCRKVWISCLHIVDSMGSSLSNKWTNYLLDKFHSGNYPIYESRQLEKNAKVLSFKLLREENLTKDYYMTSVLEPTHFGKCHFKLNLYRFYVLVINILLDPNWFQRILWFCSENWMNQFNSKNIEQSPQQLLWLLFQAPLPN